MSGYSIAGHKYLSNFIKVGLLNNKYEIKYRTIVKKQNQKTQFSNAFALYVWLRVSGR